MGDINKRMAHFSPPKIYKKEEKKYPCLIIKPNTAALERNAR
jgi:hypothetical protein